MKISKQMKLIKTQQIMKMQISSPLIITIFIMIPVILVCQAPEIKLSEKAGKKPSYTPESKSLLYGQLGNPANEPPRRTLPISLPTQVRLPMTLLYLTLKSGVLTKSLYPASIQPLVGRHRWLTCSFIRT